MLYVLPPRVNYEDRSVLAVCGGNTRTAKATYLLRLDDECVSWRSGLPLFRYKLLHLRLWPDGLGEDIQYDGRHPTVGDG